MCSAPGGKSLVLSLLLFNSTDDAKDSNAIQLICNEKSQPRQARLNRVLWKYLPEHIITRVRVTGRDATRWHETSVYDRILVDVPCSSERHLVHEALKSNSNIDPKQWSPSRCKRYASIQVALLRSAIMAAKTGALIVYSTCSIASVENEKVIRRVLKKVGSQIKVKQNQALKISSRFDDFS